MSRFAIFQLACLLLTANAHSQIAEERLPGGQAAILLYHHVSTETPGSTSVTPAVFQEHLEYLATQDFKVWPLPQIADYLQSGRELPPRTVAITFDDAYVSVYETALPLLRKRGWPFTVFVATDYIRDEPGSYMSWAQLRDITRQGGTVANHSASHEHLLRHLENESDAQWRARVIADVTAAGERIRQELAIAPSLFAYPYGEYDPPLEALIATAGYVAFGQHSGPAGALSPLTALPRFPMASGFDDLDSLAEKLRSRPLPVSQIEPAERILGPPAGPPVLRLRIADGAFRRADMRCFVSNQEPAAIRWNNEIAIVTAYEPLRAGRSKFTCTAPSTEHAGVFYWYSHLWIQQGRDGSWHSG